MKKNLFFLAAATIALASCSNEEVIEMSRQSDGIDFRAAISNGTTSRGVETTQANFTQFYVTAMYGNQEWFSNVLFSKKGTQNLYESDEDYLWPGHGSLDFYAWGYNAGMNGLIPNPLESSKYGTVSIDKTLQQLEFTPAHNIEDQIDLVTAFQTATKSDVKEDGIGLTFNHALCEIQINAQSSNPDYVFDVCGFSICKIQNKGILALKPIASALDDDPSTEPNSPWSFNVSDKDDYVKFFTPGEKDENGNTLVATRLNSTPTEISGATDSKIGFVMPIPQALTAWDHVTDPKNSQKGAFIAVLVKITNKDTNQQVYPRRPDDAGVSAGDSRDVPGYGWACVPISTVWKPGYRYIYNLDFSYGAGQFDPEDPYQPGEDILGGPIKFNVVVTDWVNADNIDVNMNGHDTNEQNGDTPVVE